MTTAEIFSLIISIAALVMSLIALVVESRRDYNITKIDLHASICGRIFDDFLVDDIPAARKELKFMPNGKLSGWNKMSEELIDILPRALYYKYDDQKFYERLKSQCMDLQTDIVLTANLTFNDDQMQKAFFENVQTKIESIYTLIDNKRTMGKVEKNRCPITGLFKNIHTS